MKIDENDGIRYLMKEMDPSEEINMERAMMEDDDLLIEVECMRQTMHRLDELPKKKPSAELTASIIKQAGEHAKNRNQYHQVSVAVPEAFKYAAVLLIGMGLGSGAWMYFGQPEESISSAKATSAHSSTASVSQIGGPAASSSFENASDHSRKVTPWVDHNDIIYYQDKFNKSNVDFDALARESQSKLTRVKKPFFNNVTSRDVELTSAHK